MDSKIAKADAKHEKLHSQKRKKDSSDRKVGNEIFDKITLETLYKLANQGYIDVLNGAISTGKEANVLTGVTDDEDFVAELSFVEDLGFDELDMADLTMDVEDGFGIELSDESLEAIKTIGDLVKFIENNIE